jgi:hypothetical protein
MNKNVLKPVALVSAGDMSGNITSDAINIQFLDSVSMQLAFTGNPTGTFAVQGSLDYYASPADPDAVLVPGTWTSLTLSPVPVAAGSADNILIDMYGLSFPYIRLVYTSTSGSGTLTANVSGKSI